MGDPRPFLRKALTNADASIEHVSDDPGDPVAIGKALVTGYNKFISAQVTWFGVVTPSGMDTGSGVVFLEHSPDGSAGSWNTNDRRTLALEPSSGMGEIAADRLTNECWRVRYEPNSVESGFVNVVVYSY